MNKILLFFISFLLTAFFPETAGQTLTPRPSPNSKITQLIGVSDITIAYSRPGVKDRKIWGELVPYNKVWRTGANESTTIELTTDGMIEGKKITAGKYSVFTIPQESEWTVIINKDIEGGIAKYSESNDLLRFKVKPETNPYTERLTFDFENLSDNSANIVLKWDKVKVPIKIEFDTAELVMKGINSNLSWGAANSGAAYLLQEGKQTSEALRLADISTLINENYWNLRIKAQLLAKSGKKDEAVKTMEKAIEYGKKMEQKPFDFAEMEKMLSGWKG